MFCSNCGKEVSGKYCPNCGIVLSEAALATDLSVAIEGNDINYADHFINVNGVEVNVSDIIKK